VADGVLNGAVEPKRGAVVAVQALSALIRAIEHERKIREIEESKSASATSSVGRGGRMSLERRIRALEDEAGPERCDDCREWEE
jgi:hypothetical protein